jgi:hypothetical protein
VRSGSQVSETPLPSYPRASAIRIATAVTRPTMVSRIARIAAPLPTNIALTFMSNDVKHILPPGKRMGDDRGKIRGLSVAPQFKTKEFNMAELRDQILIKAASAKVYAAIAIQAGMRDWWTADSKTEDTVGGKCPETGAPLGSVFCHL